MLHTGKTLGKSQRDVQIEAKLEITLTLFFILDVMPVLMHNLTLKVLVTTTDA